MVIVRISHGLGNQMFQYALGHALAAANRSTLKLDLTHYRSHQDRAYGLDHFCVSATDATDAEISAISGCPPGERKRGLARHLDQLRRAFCPGDQRQVVREIGRRFDARVLERRGQLYLMGYWQARGYVEAAAASLRPEFALASPPSADNARWLDTIRRQPTVSIHVRRGDYVNHPRFEMADPLTYYRAAFGHIAQREEGLQCLIFSDDLPWAEANLQLPATMHFIGNNQATPEEDMRLMSSCDHQIIANSTFSWWAAWLNPNPRKMVCAPRTWLNNDPQAAADLLPPEWELV